jgi:hypothetical protein
MSHPQSICFVNHQRLASRVKLVLVLILGFKHQYYARYHNDVSHDLVGDVALPLSFLDDKLFEMTLYMNNFRQIKIRLLEEGIPLPSLSHYGHEEHC